MKFERKTIVVTGSGKEKGLGQAILQRFADEGANCVVSDRRLGAHEEGVAAELRKRGAKTAAIACDVRDPTQCQALVAQTVERFGGVDIFVNNAGIGFMMKPLLEVEASDWKTGDRCQSVRRFFTARKPPQKQCSKPEKAGESSISHRKPLRLASHICPPMFPQSTA